MIEVVHATGAGRIMARLDELAALSSDEGALTRLYLSAEHKSAAVLVGRWMERAGMTVSLDAVGNVVGRYAGRTATAKTLILGSHIDTVRNAGRFDGCLGVVLAIEAVASLWARGERLPFAIEVVAFGDEEGVRFPEALAGSRAVAGGFQNAALDVLDANGVALREALVAFGCNPAAIPGIARQRGTALGYLEVHIEQGPVLESEGLPVGIVTAIAGASRFTLTVSGMAGHAGTVPMRLRRDAFCAAAEMALLVEATAAATPDLVATVGWVGVQPGAVNVIAGETRFTLDIRSPHDETRIAAITTLREGFAAIARRRGVDLAIEGFYDEPAAPCAPIFREVFARAIEAQGLRAIEMPSGAGHDGLAMVELCPIGMLFVRCAGGISHNPAESIEPKDAAVALDVLVASLRGLAADSRPA